MADSKYNFYPQFCARKHFQNNILKKNLLKQPVRAALIFL